MTSRADIEAGELIAIKLEVRVPVAATAAQTEEWLDYSLGHRSDIALDNPLIDCELAPFGRDALQFERTGCVGTREEYGHELKEDGTYYRVRYRRERIKSDSGPGERAAQRAGA